MILFLPVFVCLHTFMQPGGLHPLAQVDTSSYVALIQTPLRGCKPPVTQIW